MAYKYTQSSTQMQGPSTEGPGAGQFAPTLSNQDQMDASGLAMAEPINAIPGDLVEKIKKRLSYSWRDWKISESDATYVMSELNRLSINQISQVLTKLDDEHIERLLKAAPVSSMPVDYVAKVVTALGPEGVEPFCDSLMSRGAFDWIISDEDAKAVGRVIQALSETQREQLIENMDEDKVERLMRNLNTDYMLTELISARFEVDFGSAQDIGLMEGTRWSVAGMRETWEVLEELPESHVQDNDSLAHMGRYSWGESEESSGSGYYQPSTGSIGIEYNDNLLDEEILATGMGAGVSDAIVGAQVFEHTVRHEIGHAVDDQINGFDRLCKRSIGGHWQEYSSSELPDLADQILASSDGAVAMLEGNERAAIVGLIVDEMTKGSADGLDSRIAGCWVALERGISWTAELLNDQALEVLRVAMAEPWWSHPDGGVAIKGRIYQQSYPGYWTSYAETARQNRVSGYQFRAPGEWFAEIYANYYDPRNEAPGEMLSAADPAAKRWFDRYVHSMQNLKGKWGREGS